MRETVAKCVVVMAAGFALIVTQGYRKQAAPTTVQSVVASGAPGARPDFPGGPLPVEDVDTVAKPRVDRVARRPYQVQPGQAESKDAQAAAAAQRRQDERLLQQQEAASQRQQEELNQDIEQTVKMQQEMQAEPRIQDNPGPQPQPAPLELTQPQ
jgi:hypothetical protein